MYLTSPENEDAVKRSSDGRRLRSCGVGAFLRILRFRFIGLMAGITLQLKTMLLQGTTKSLTTSKYLLAQGDSGGRVPWLG